MSTTPNPIIITDMPEEDYHASSGMGQGQYVTRSMVKDFNVSVRGFALRHVVRASWAQRSKNDGMTTGELFEAMTLKDREITVRPTTYTDNKGEVKPWSGNAKVCKKWLEDNSDKLIASASMVDQVKNLRAAFRQAPMVAWMLRDLQDRQVVVRWIDEITGLRCQVRIDMVCKRALGDLKTGAKKPEDFSTSARDYGYDLQAAMYTDAWELATGERLPFLFPYQQTEWPFRSDVIELDPAQVEYGRKKYREGLDGIAACIASGHWEDHQRNEALVPEIKPWVFYEMELSGEGAPARA